MWCAMLINTRYVKKLLALAFVFLIAGSTSAAPVAVPLLSYVVTYPNGEWSRVRVFANQLEYSSGKGAGAILYTSKKTLTTAGSTGLLKAWQEKTYDVSAWPSEWGCDSQVQWRVVATGGKRTICKDAKALSHLTELHAAVLTLF